MASTSSSTIIATVALILAVLGRVQGQTKVCPDGYTARGILCFIEVERVKHTENILTLPVKCNRVGGKPFMFTRLPAVIDDIIALLGTTTEKFWINSLRPNGNWLLGEEVIEPEDKECKKRCLVYNVAIHEFAASKCYQKNSVLCYTFPKEPEM